ncbi:MAG: LD-carboxypeptidase [Anaerolineae bacterium]|nr:LD-carboxypeptidase [Anaerolineae bacterium]
MSTFIVPPRLKPGDRVAIVQPAAGLALMFPHVYQLGLRRLREVFGLEPVEFPTTRMDRVELAAHPERRAEDLHAAFSDPSIAGVIAVIGGNDQYKILKYLDPAILRANPKVFMGYSDNTSLHLFLWKLGLVSYYGGMVLTQFAMQGAMHAYSADGIRRAVFDEAIGLWGPAPEYTDVDLPWNDVSLLDTPRPMFPSPERVWVNAAGKRISGRLWGGCLEVFDTHLAMRAHLPDFDALNGTVLFIETSEEMPPTSMVDRILSVMGEIGLLQRFAAVLVGRPKARHLRMEPPEGPEAYAAAQRETITRVVDEYNPAAPIVFNLDFGHTEPQIPLPSGGIVTLDSDARTLTLSYD